MFEGLFQRASANGDAVVALDPTGSGPILGDLTTNFALSQPFLQTTEFFKNSLAWTFSDLTLTSVSSYSDTHNHQVEDVSAVFLSLFPLVTGAPGLAPQTVDVRLHKYTEEIRLASETGRRLEWMLGGFTTYEEVVNDQAVDALGLDLQPNVLDPILIASLPSRYREQAIFGDLSWQVLGGWSISGGLRYSHNSQNYLQSTSGLLSPGAPEGGHSSQGVTTYSATSKYQFTPSTMTYVRVASGYEPGGPNVALQGVPPTVEASTLTNYEAGIKTEAFQRRLQLDLAVFRMNWKKIQTTAVTQTSLQYLVNGGEARSQGVEMSATIRPTRRLSLATSFAYTDATFTTAIASLGTVPGQRLPAVPRLSASAVPQYELSFADGWDATFGAGVRYVGSRPVDLFAPAGAVTFNERGYVVFDLSAQVARGDWKVGFFAKNLLDRRAYLTETGIPDAVTGSIVQVDGALLQPRTIGLSIDRLF
jgi:iron complex outermembrane receptor protein